MSRRWRRNLRNSRARSAGHRDLIEGVGPSTAPHYNEEFLKPFREKECELDMAEDDEEDSADFD
jgi:hypothetical protein